MAEQLTSGAVEFLKKNSLPLERGLPDGYVVQMLELERTQGKIAKYRYVWCARTFAVRSALLAGAYGP
jgi:hypothetical protein